MMNKICHGTQDDGHLAMADLPSRRAGDIEILRNRKPDFSRNGSNDPATLVHYRKENCLNIVYS